MTASTIAAMPWSRDGLGARSRSAGRRHVGAVAISTRLATRSGWRTAKACAVMPPSDSPTTWAFRSRARAEGPRDRRRGRRSSTGPSTHLRNGHGRACRSAGSIARRERAHLRVPHFERRAERVREGHAPALGRAGQVVEEIDAVGVDQWAWFTDVREDRRERGEPRRARDRPTGRRRRSRAQGRTRRRGARATAAQNRLQRLARLASTSPARLLDQLVRLLAAERERQSAPRRRRRRAGPASRRDSAACAPDGRLSPSARSRASASAPEARPKSGGSACHSPCQSPAGRSWAAAMRGEQRRDEALARRREPPG